METSVTIELLHVIKDGISDFENTEVEELANNLFNSDYYIIGYYQCEQWLKNHNISAFDAIADCMEYEKDQFGESYLKPEDINSEKIVNLLVYFYGMELSRVFWQVESESGLVDSDYIEQVISKIDYALAKLER